MRTRRLVRFPQVPDALMPFAPDGCVFCAENEMPTTPVSDGCRRQAADSGMGVPDFRFRDNCLQGVPRLLRRLEQVFGRHRQCDYGAP